MSFYVPAKRKPESEIGDYVGICPVCRDRLAFWHEIRCKLCDQRRCVWCPTCQDHRWLVID
jgi:uncharacterized CHY-type Zn-finger protein